ncbi:MAG: hypothetical protein ABH812_01315 [bacterium]
MKVLPAILTPNIDSFWEQIERLLPYYSYFQIDIMDGTYGENKTISLEDIANTLNKHLKIINTAKFDFQFITKKPEIYSTKMERLYKHLNIEFVFFHYKSSPKINLLYAQLDIKHGVALDPDDSVDEFRLNYDLKSIKNIIIMTVFPEGQGQPFHEYPLNKIEQLRNTGYRNKISIDGGVNENTIPLILSKKFKPDFLNIGSFFSKAQNLKKNIQTVKELISNP